MLTKKKTVANLVPMEHFHSQALQNAYYAQKVHIIIFGQGNIVASLVHQDNLVKKAQVDAKIAQMEHIQALALQNAYYVQQVHIQITGQGRNIASLAKLELFPVKKDLRTVKDVQIIIILNQAQINVILAPLVIFQIQEIPIVPLIMAKKLQNVEKENII